MIKALLHYLVPRRQLLALIERGDNHYHMTMRESGWFTLAWTTRQFLVAGITVWENRDEVRDESLIHWVIEKIDDHETDGLAVTG